MLGRRRKESDLDALSAISKADGFEPPAHVVPRPAESAAQAAATARSSAAATKASAIASAVAAATAAKAAATKATGTTPATPARPPQIDVPHVEVGDVIGRVMRWVKISAVLAGVVIVASIAVGAIAVLVDDSSSSPTATSPGLDGGGTTTPSNDKSRRPEKPGKPATPAAPTSLISQRGFLGAMRALRSHGGGRVMNLRIAADRVDAQLVRGGRLAIVQVSRERGYTEIGVSVSAPPVATAPLSAINSRLPGLIAARAAARAHKHVRDIDYLVFTPAGGDFAWNLFFQGGEHWTAKRDGSNVRPGGTPPS